jgi:predicted nucleotidyltransferase component of viral defense system
VEFAFEREGGAIVGVAKTLMITRHELRRQAMRQGVALGALEKDYILTLILQRLYAEQTWRQVLIFKGGTALHKFYLGRRLSLDLDFTAQEAVSLDRIRPALEAPEIQGQIKDFREYHDALTIDRLGFVGPLQHLNSVKIDISFRERVQLAPRRLILYNPYGSSFEVTCMTLEEIMAEKIRAALMRNAPRDYFDLWLLFQQKDVAFAILPALLKAKLNTVNYPYEPQRLWDGPEALRRIWDDDLRQLTRDVPPFDRMFRELRTRFEQKMPQTL